MLPAFALLFCLGVNRANAQDDTATGTGALQHVTTGQADTADGYGALSADTTGSYNTAIGWSALQILTGAARCTAAGAGALQKNLTVDNTAFGYGALNVNSLGIQQTAIGSGALYKNESPLESDGGGNTACGYQALYANRSGLSSTATGAFALAACTAADQHVADGFRALASFANGYDNQGNVALGSNAMQSCVNSAAYNVAIGADSFGRVTGYDPSDPNYPYQAPYFDVGLGAEVFNTPNFYGNFDVAIGYGAGRSVTSSSYSIYINSAGSPARASAIYIGQQGVQTSTTVAGIYGEAASDGVAVYINSAGQFGTLTSSERYKEDIRDIGAASDRLLSLRPVTFRYQPGIDPKGVAQCGLVAEEVEKIDPALVVHDPDGRPYSVRYEQVNAMLLNAFLKDKQEVSRQGVVLAGLQGTVAEHQRELAAASARQRQALDAAAARDEAEMASLASAIKEQTAILQKASQELERNQPKPQMVANGE